MADPTPADLAAVDRALKWCAFLLGMMLLILLIDLQLVRSLGRQAVTLAQKYAALNRMTDTLIEDLRGAGSGGSGMAKAAGRGGDAGVGGPDGVDGTPSGTATDASAGNTVKAAQAAHPPRTRKRPGSDGPGTGGDTGE